MYVCVSHCESISRGARDGDGDGGGGVMNSHAVKGMSRLAQLQLGYGVKALCRHAMTQVRAHSVWSHMKYLGQCHSHSFISGMTAAI